MAYVCPEDRSTRPGSATLGLGSREDVRLVEVQKRITRAPEIRDGREAHVFKIWATMTEQQEFNLNKDRVEGSPSQVFMGPRAV